MDTKSTEYYEFRFPWRYVESILPQNDKKIYDSWTRQNFVPSKEGDSSNTGKGRGKARSFSVASCVGLATLWELVSMGFKPSDCLSIVESVISRGQRIFTDFQAENKFIDSGHPLLVFRVIQDQRKNTLDFISSNRVQIGNFISNPTSKDGKIIKSVMKMRASVREGSPGSFYYFEIDDIYNVVIPQYFKLRDEILDL